MPVSKVLNIHQTSKQLGIMGDDNMFVHHKINTYKKWFVTPAALFHEVNVCDRRVRHGG